MESQNGLVYRTTVICAKIARKRPETISRENVRRRNKIRTQMAMYAVETLRIAGTGGLALYYLDEIAVSL